MGNQSEAADILEDITDSIPESVSDKTPSGNAPPVEDSEGNIVRLDDGHSQLRPTNGTFSIGQNIKLAKETDSK